ncbi:hypothetical protein QF117_04035 [Vibrio sp. YMD68]|uniref:hypothetical protein n=1 Tax=Vibrio sp. YMD68 TaxID=3042300 RepID=UPI002499AF3A|nr:hypothetical protein [Vibrio sp. YMD68]WGV98035.1 hypothetical protein QF117_04035 [Vibrio sp. YMD68]
MEFTSSLLVTLIGVVCSSYVTVQIMHSKSKNEAISELKIIGTKVLNLAVFGFVCFQLYQSVYSPEPLTRFAVFEICLLVATILYLLILRSLNRILGVIENLTRIQDKQLDLHDRHLGITEKLNVQSPADQSPNKALKTD